MYLLKYFFKKNITHGQLDKMLGIGSGLQGTNGLTSTRLPVSPVTPLLLPKPQSCGKCFPAPLKRPLAVCLIYSTYR